MKLRTYAQTIFALQEYVETKGRETDFVAMKENVMGLVREAQQAGEGPQPRHVSARAPRGGLRRGLSRDVAALRARAG